MELGCEKNTENIYFRCRKESARCNDRLSSREGAAELLGISTSTLSNYELGVTKQVPPDSVVMMADLYNAPELKAHYCANECPIGRTGRYVTETSSIEKATLKLVATLASGKLDDAKDRLVEIAAAGEIVGEKDKLALQQVLDVFYGISAVIEEIRLLGEKCLGGKEMP